jgi:carotenoid cleavage dioxygenase-like enzyme
MRRDDPDRPVRWFDVDPCYVFHVAKAHDDDNSIVLQAVRYPNCGATAARSIPRR